MVGVVGIALKGFGKALKVVKDTGLHKGSVRKATSPKVMGTQRPKTKSDFRLKNLIKKIQKEPDKRFKHQNPATEKVKSLRTGREFEVRKKDPVKGSLGKKTYIQDTKYYHHANKPRTRKFAGALVRGAKNIVKHTPWRKELAGLKRTYRTKQKILGAQAGRAKQAKQKAFETKHIKPASQETKVAISRSRNPKTWRRAGKLSPGWGNR